ncbi:MAG: galactose oxidase, partial [Saprospiraceae bacterium]|nr:galactose oxidase [Saprospiraceae bacterium]
MRSLTYLIILSSIILFQNCTNEIPENWQWETVKTIGQPTARHEAGLVSYQDKLYLMGGRRVNPTSVYDPLVNEWTEHSPTPLEIHHFQPVVYGDKIYIVGAMTGKW